MTDTLPGDRMIDIGTVRLHVDDTGGTGRPVVLIHPWPLAAAAWDAQVPALRAAGYRVVRYDRRGFGLSDKPDTGYDYDTLTDDLAALLERLDLRDATLVGMSMGGGEVVRYLSRHGSERVRSVVLLAAVPPMVLQTPDNPDGPFPPAARDEFAAALHADREAHLTAFMTPFFSAGDTLQVSPAQLDEALAMARQACDAAVEGCMDAWSRTDFRPDLPAVTVPTLILHGDSDGPLPFEGSGARAHAAIPGSRVVLIEGGPHGVITSHPDEVNAALLEFLDE